MRGAIKRIILIALVIAGFVAFDATMDFMGRHLYPALFSIVVYPVDLAGTIEYTVGSAVLYLSSRKSIEWLNTGTIAAFAYSFVIIAQKLIFR